MLSIKALDFGFNDAENYRQRDRKEFFNRIFVRNETLEQICDSKNYFIVGEKGTGKTAYAVYMTNNAYRETRCRIVQIRETEYLRFLNLKRERHLTLSDYVDVWKVLILLLMSENVLADAEKHSVVDRFVRLRRVKDAVDEFYESAFSPELINAIRFVENSELSAKLISKHAEAGAKSSGQLEASENRFQINLLQLERAFETGLKSIRLKDSHLLFVDGIDIRPYSIAFPEYLECVKGLAAAVWSLNKDFFANIKDSHGRMRVLLLVRPDIFDSLGLQNQNTKLHDNSVLLNWQTTYKDHRTSPIFQVADQILSGQQTSQLGLGEAWDYYFPFKRTRKKGAEDPFVQFLRLSYYRPRDIITILGMLRERALRKRGDCTVFVDDDADTEFMRNFADYLLGEVKDQLSFYYSPDDYDLFIQFFEYLDGQATFDYETFLSAYNRFAKFLRKNGRTPPVFLETADRFLQFLYELNVVGFELERQGEKFFQWCFRERTYADIRPKIQAHSLYHIHRGISRALHTGKPAK